MQKTREIGLRGWVFAAWALLIVGCAWGKNIRTKRKYPQAHGGPAVRDQQLETAIGRERLKAQEIL